MIDIQRGVIWRPPKLVIYGSEGIGKTTLASHAPDPLFIDTEGGSNFLNVKRAKPPASWEELIATVKEVAETPGICKTLVVDTADWAEALAAEKVCRQNGVSSIASIPYGHGHVLLADTFMELLAALNKCISAGIAVIVIAHAKMRKFEEPDELGAYDRWEMKLSKQVAPLLKEWCDALLYCNYKNIIVTADSGKKKAQGGRRVMYTDHRPAFDAKNRFGLSDELDMDFNEISFIFADNSTTTNTASVSNQTPLERLRSLIVEADLSENDVKSFVVGQGYVTPDKPLDNYDNDLIQGLINNWTDIANYIRAAK